MNKRTKLFVGIALLVSAFTTMFTFISLCFKKKGMLAALAAFATAEGLIGLALIEDNSKRRPKTAAEVDAEIFADDIIDLSEVAEDAPSTLDFDVPKDEEASEEDFQ